jgi:sigma-B regulation protein RsbU (phosphoserine phosphatase)
MGPSRTGRKLHDFWERISDGIAIHQLWAQFRADARDSYQFYSKELDHAPVEGESRGKRVLRTARGLFWAMILKLSPGRRVLLLIALVLLLFPTFSINRSYETNRANKEDRSDSGAPKFFAGVVLIVLLALELSDRVTMKRDLEIAREIQSWLMPAEAPIIPGLDIAFANRPANTVAGDYYDVFLRPNQRLLIVMADVVGKSVPAALLTATLQASLRTLAALPTSLVELVGQVNLCVRAEPPGTAIHDRVRGRVGTGHRRPGLRERGPQLARAAARLGRDRAPAGRGAASRHHRGPPVSGW